jgi:hypothetical protein
VEGGGATAPDLRAPPLPGLAAAPLDGAARPRIGVEHDARDLNPERERYR